MGRNSKWITSDPNDATRCVARRAIARRLERVGHFLELAATAPASEVENVHQLRVFARRAEAALNIFSDWLPPKRAAWMQKQIKKVRQAAGHARDFDVLAIRWSEDSGGMPSEQLSPLLDAIRLRRDAAQQPIEAIYEKLLLKKFDRKTARLARRIRFRGDEPSNETERFGCMARRSLAALAADYLRAGDAELTDDKALHAFRIQGKHVRYALEIFAGAFADDLRSELYPMLALLQERIGKINDHASAAAHFAQWQAECESCEARQALTTAIEQERRALETSRRAFLDWWNAERREELRQGFARHVDLCKPRAI